MPILPSVGGSFAPPLSDELLAAYKALIDALDPSPVKDAMTTLYNCCAKWWDLPESNGTARPHPSGRGQIVNLDHTVRSELDPHVPWNHELDAMHGVDESGKPRLLEALDPESQRELRNAAFHLLWHVKELALGEDQGEWGREPITTNLL